MRTDDLWQLTVLLWPGLPWLMAYLISGITSVTHLTSPKKQIPKLLTPCAEDACPNCR